MKTRFYVVFDKSGAKRLTKKYLPSTYRNEVVVGFSVTIPDGVFTTPLINADVDVPEDRAIVPDSINVGVEAQVGDDDGAA